jgi:hypothetical protein
MLNKTAALNKKEIDIISGGFLLPKSYLNDLDIAFTLALMSTAATARKPVAPLATFIAGIIGFVITPKIGEYLTNPPSPKEVPAN